MNTETMKLAAKDLTKEYPRSPRETLAGYVIAARALDKCRSAIAGTLGEYHFDCPLDRYFFRFTGIDAESFRSFVATAPLKKQDLQIIDIQQTVQFLFFLNLRPAGVPALWQNLKFGVHSRAGAD